MNFAASIIGMILAFPSGIIYATLLAICSGLSTSQIVMIFPSGARAGRRGKPHHVGHEGEKLPGTGQGWSVS
jgi:hypothetical protein